MTKKNGDGGEVGFGIESTHGMWDAELNRRGYGLACLPRTLPFSLSPSTSKRPATQATRLRAVSLLLENL